MKTSISIILLCFMLAACGSATVTGLVDMPAYKGTTVSSVTVRAFNTNSYRRTSGAAMATLLKGKLSDAGHVRVVNRGADGVLGGALRSSRLESNSWTDSRTDKKGQTHYTYYYRQQKSVTADYELRTRGDTVAGSYTETFERQYFSPNSPSEARSYAWAEQVIDDKLLTALATRIMRDISPHKEQVTFRFKDNGNDDLKLGVKYAQKGRFDQSLSIFRQVADGATDTKTRAAALYNTGVIHEMRGEFEQAFSQYRDANQFDLREDLYLDALTRVEKRVKEHRAFEAQTGK